MIDPLKFIHIGFNSQIKKSMNNKRQPKGHLEELDVKFVENVNATLEIVTRNKNFRNRYV